MVGRVQPAEIGVVLGSGLGAFAEQLSQAERIEYSEIPHMPTPSVIGHAGSLTVGRAGAARVMCLQGRVHLYEGHPVDRVVFGVRLLRALGCKQVLLTNAAGGIEPSFSPGSLMLIVDHLNLTGRSPLIGDLALERFVDMSRAYDPELCRLAQSAAEQVGVPLKSGVYAGVLGPSYETPAEVRMLRLLGAHAVGMSTVLETIALARLGVKVGAVSCITNYAAGLTETPLSHLEVAETARRVQEPFVLLLRTWCELIAAHNQTTAGDSKL